MFTIANRNLLSPNQLFQWVTQFQYIVDSKREKRSGEREAHRVMKEASTNEELDELLEVSPKIFEPGSMTAENRILRCPPAFYSNMDSENAWKEGKVGKQGCHISPIPPENFQQLPGQTNNHRLGPNCIFTPATLQLIRHLPNDPLHNDCQKVWFGGLGFPAAFCFFFGHWGWAYVLVVGNQYYAYFIFPENARVWGNAHQLRWNNTPVASRHAGLCYYNCDENEHKNGPFVQYNMCISFELTKGLTPSSSKFRVSRLRHSVTGIMREMDLSIDDPRLSASATRVYCDGVRGILPVSSQSILPKYPTYTYQ